MRTGLHHSGSPLTLLLFLSCPALAACGADAPGDAPAASVRDSAGVRIVQNGEVGAWGAAAPTVTEALRIGVLEGEDAYQFFHVYSLAMDEDGVLFVGNDQTGSVRVFDADGTFLREFGRKGSGPGEYVMINRVWLAGDQIAVTDWQRGGRTGIYTKDGELVAFWQMLQPDGSMITPRAWSPEGWLATVTPRSQLPSLADGEPFERRSGLGFYDPEADTVGPPVVMFPPQVLYGSSQTEGLDWSLFAPLTSSGIDAAGRVFMSYGDPYRVEVHRLDGTLEQVVTRTHPPVPLGEDDVEQLVSMIAARYDTSSLPNAREEKERITARVRRQRSFDPRTTVAPTGRLLISPDGSFWLERTDAADPAITEYVHLFGFLGGLVPRPTYWDLFDAEGRYLTAVELPARFEPMAVVGTSIAGVLKDEMDVEYVVVYSVAAPAGSDP